MESDRPQVAGTKAPMPGAGKATIGIATFLLLIGVAAVGSWFLGPNALGQQSASNTEQNNTFLFMLVGPVAIPIGLYFLYLWHRERRSAAEFAAAEEVEGVITHLWKDSKSNADQKYRVGYSAPNIPPAYVCVDVKTFKKLSVGDTVKLRVASGKGYIDL